MSTRSRRFAATLLLALGSATAGADVVVVVSPENPLSSLTRREVADNFMGK